MDGSFYSNFNNDQFFAEKEPGKKRFGIKYDSYFMAYYFIILIESLNVL